METKNKKKITRDDLKKFVEVGQALASALDSPSTSMKLREEPAPLVIGRVGSRTNIRGPAAASTGYGTGRTVRADIVKGFSASYQEFMDYLDGMIRKAGNKLSVTEQTGWVKLEAVETGHRIYISKSKQVVTRVTSTLPPELVPGAAPPDRHNGMIKSWIPADPDVVAEALVTMLAQTEPPYSDIPRMRNNTAR